jgi:hypothetical protein
MMEKIRRRLEALERTMNPDPLRDFPADELAAIREDYPAEYDAMLQLPAEERIVALCKIVGTEMAKHV